MRRRQHTPAPTADAGTPIVRLLSPLRDFLHTEASGAILIALATAAALVWANSPWSASYETVWTTDLVISLGDRSLALDLRHWVNDGLMTIFFLVVGLEIKRELTIGHLASRRAASLPVVAAVGGMVVPALVYLAIAGGTEPAGWAVPTATDIALAIGVLSAAGSRVLPSMRAFLLGLAIVDDVGAIVIIAVVFSTGISWSWLLVAIALVGGVVLAAKVGVQRHFVYVVIGVVMWFALHEAGVHATLAGVVMGLLAPVTPRIPAEFVDAEELLDLSTVEAARTTSDLARASVSVVEWLQHILHPWTSYLIVPVFALANAGIKIDGDSVSAAVKSPITWGIVAGLVIGKPLGIVVTSRLAVRAGITDRARGRGTPDAGCRRRRRHRLHGRAVHHRTRARRRAGSAVGQAGDLGGVDHRRGHRPRLIARRPVHTPFTRAEHGSNAAFVGSRQCSALLL